MSTVRINTKANNGTTPAATKTPGATPSAINQQQQNQDNNNNGSSGISIMMNGNEQQQQELDNLFNLALLEPTESQPMDVDMDIDSEDPRIDVVTAGYLAKMYQRQKNLWIGRQNLAKHQPERFREAFLKHVDPGVKFPLSEQMPAEMWEEKAKAIQANYTTARDYFLKSIVDQQVIGLEVLCKRATDLVHEYLAAYPEGQQRKEEASRVLKQVAARAEAEEAKEKIKEQRHKEAARHRDERRRQGGRGRFTEASNNYSGNEPSGTSSGSSHEPTPSTSTSQSSLAANNPIASHSPDRRNGPRGRRNGGSRRSNGYNNSRPERSRRRYSRDRTGGRDSSRRRSDRGGRR